MRALTTWTLAVALLACAACGRTTNDENAATASDSATTSEVSPDTAASGPDTAGGIALRPDGCPVVGQPGWFSGRTCPIGKICEYPAECSASRVKYSVYRCHRNEDYSTGWSQSESECRLLSGPDGCPLGTAAGTTCTEPGKVCYYRRCGSPTDGTVDKYNCKAADGGYKYYREWTLGCADADGGT